MRPARLAAKFVLEIASLELAELPADDESERGDHPGRADAAPARPWHRLQAWRRQRPSGTGVRRSFALELRPRDLRPERLSAPARVGVAARQRDPDSALS